jgi:hypothetical protein
MRRHLIVFMMLLLPLQWSWAAAASVCAHEVGTASHFGHHAHDHEGAQPADHPDDDTSGSQVPDFHADCGVCHGIATGLPGPQGGMPSPAPARDLLPSSDRTLPDPPVDPLLRPPLNLLA